MNRRVSKLVCNLSKIILAVTDHLFCSLYFHAGKVFNDTTAGLIPENLLNMGTAYQMGFADFIDFQLAGYIILKVVADPLKNQLVLIQFF